MPEPVLLVCLGVGLVLYTLLIYPALLGVLSAWRPRAAISSPQRKTVAIVIPVRNGERFIAEKLRSVLDLEYPKELLEILVVSDGSTDSTDAIVERFSPEGVQLLRVPHRGKPAALNAAFERTRGEILFLTDVRQVVARNSLQALVDGFADPAVGAVSGAIFIRKGQTEDELAVGLYWRFEAWIRERLSRIDSIFGATGPFYAIRREVIVRLPEDILLDDVYLPMAAFLAGRRLIVESRAVAWDIPLSLKTEFHRKVRTIAGNYQMLAACPAVLGCRNRMWFHFMSYKVARLFLPYACLLTAAASPFLPAPWNWLAIAAQTVFYGLALIEPLVPERSALKRVCSTIRMFCALLLATVCALQILFVPPRRLWRVTNMEVETGDPPAAKQAKAGSGA